MSRRDLWEPGGATPPGHPTSAVFGLLSGLVARSLVVAQREGTDTRYRLLETIREYAEERLAEHGETEEVRLRHGEHFDEYSRVLFERYRGPEQAEAMRLLGAENDNLLAAMADALDSGNIDLALRLLTSRKGLEESNVQPLPVDVLSMPRAG